MKKIVLRLSEEAGIYIEGIALLVRRYQREIMPNKKTGPSNTVVFKLNGDNSVNEIILVKIYHTKTSVEVKGSVMVTVDESKETEQWII